MTDQIFSITQLQHRAQAAYAAGVDAQECPFDTHISASAIWHEEYAQLEAAAAGKPSAEEN